MSILSDEQLKFLSGINRTLLSLPELSAKVLLPNETCIIVVDMVNGFAKDGALASEDVLKINDKIADFITISRANKIDVYALADSHSEHSPEFACYPAHCLENTRESQLTDELLNAGKITVINKNSTNGFLEEKFKSKILGKGYSNFIIIGCCTDICVQQLALTLKAEFNRQNIVKRIIVPYNLVATYNSPAHNSTLCQMFALYNLSINGIEVVKKII